MTPPEPTAAPAAPGAAAPAFYGRPFLWLLLALGLLAVPAVGAMWRSGMPWAEIHPAINAILNAISAIFLLTGFVAIRRRHIALHRSCMVAAVTASCIFLVSYLARFASTGTHRYPSEGWDRTLYLSILFSHMVLAAIIVPMILRALLLARRKQFVAHRRIARVLWPIWIYVSVTGVAVYLMLYHLAG